MLNRVVLIGRLVRAPELRYTPSGAAVCSFRIAVDRRWSNADGEREADFLDIVVWQKQAEACAKNLQKGRQVAVDGRLQTRSYEDRSGVRRRAVEVIAENVRFLDRPRNGEEAPASGQPAKPAESGASVGAAAEVDDDLLGEPVEGVDNFDDIPF